MEMEMETMVDRSPDLYIFYGKQSKFPFIIFALAIDRYGVQVWLGESRLSLGAMRRGGAVFMYLR